MSPLLAPLVAIAISAGVAAGTLAHVERMYGKAKADIVEIKRMIDDQHIRAARIAYTVEHMKEGSLPQWHAAGYIKEARSFRLKKRHQRLKKRLTGLLSRPRQVCHCDPERGHCVDRRQNQERHVNGSTGGPLSYAG